MTVHELVTAARKVSLFEQRKALIKALFEQLPKTEPLAGSITQTGPIRKLHLYHIRELVSHWIQRSAEQSLHSANRAIVACQCTLPIHIP